MNNPPKERGSAWERRVVDHAQAAGLPWERAPLRGSMDLLDVQGSLPDGWLVGCKAISRKGNLGDRLSDAMRQCREAMNRLPRGGLWAQVAAEVVPVQVVQRQGYPVGQAYVVMEYDEFLRLVVMRRAWNATVSEATG